MPGLRRRGNPRPPLRGRRGVVRAGEGDDSQKSLREVDRVTPRKGRLAVPLAPRSLRRFFPSLLAPSSLPSSPPLFPSLLTPPLTFPSPSPPPSLNLGA